MSLRPSLPALVAILLAALAVMSACDPDDASPEPIFPDDWATSFSNVRGCRLGPEHDLNYIALYVDPTSVPLWQQCVVYDSTCTEVFPEGATFLKAEYADPQCTDLTRISAARKSADVRFVTSGGWHWQEVQANGRVSADGAVDRCASCHATCDGSYDHRCVIDP